MDSARDLCGKDKQFSAFDYNVIYDASASDLTRIRAELTHAGGVQLVARPYVVSPHYRHKWRSAAKLGERIAAIRKKDDDNRRALPNKVLHELRESLFLGMAAAEARLQLVRERYAPQGIAALLAEDK